MADTDNKGNNSGVPLLHQYDSRWADHAYDWSTIATAGCGPTCFAMIARWYGVDITPADAADYSSAQGFHKSEGTSHDFFASAASHWNFAMKSATRTEVEEALKKGYPAIAAHGATGMFTNAGHFIVYAKLTDSGKLIVNDPNQGMGPNKRGDNYEWDLNEVLTDNASMNFSAFIPTTDHTGKSALLNNQSMGESGSDAGLINKVNIGNKSGYSGFRVTSVGSNMVKIVRLPDNKTYCEPIYPDYVTVSDTCPAWALDAVTTQQNNNTNQKSGTNMKDGDAKEKAPNGMHYSENDIKYLMENNSGMTREQAIEQLSKAEKYTRKVTQNSDGTFNVAEDTSDKSKDKNNTK